MSLIDQGNRAQTVTGINAKARDADGDVTIEASHEAVTDCGWGEIFSSAEKKLASGDFRKVGNVRIVTIHTKDLQ